MIRRMMVLGWSLALVACGGGGSSSSNSSGPTPTYSIGGTVTGLDGTGLVLQNNNGNDLTVNGNGTITFSSPVNSGTTYSITIKTQPSATPPQLCEVSNGSGTVGSASISNVAISCRVAVAKFLYVPNSNDNTLSAYQINATTGALTAVSGAPVATGVRPIWLSAPSSGKFVYVVNGGATNAVNGGANNTQSTISGFQVNALTGALVPTPNSPYVAGSLYGSNPLLDALRFHPVYDLALAANQLDGVIYAYAVDANTGELIRNASSSISYYGFGGDFNLRNGLYYQATNNFGMQTYSLDKSTGTATLQSTITSPGSNGFTQVDLAQQFVYVTSLGSKDISAFRIDPTSGALTAVNGSPFFVGGNFPVYISFHPSGKFLYVFDVPVSAPVNDTFVHAFSVDAATGALTSVGSVPAHIGSGLTFSIVPSGKYLWALGMGGQGSSIAIFAVNQNSGTLTPVNGSPFSTLISYAGGAAMDPSGNFIYVTDGFGNTVTVFAINGSTGSVTRLGSAPTGSGPGIPFVMGLQ